MRGLGREWRVAFQAFGQAEVSDARLLVGIDHYGAKYTPNVPYNEQWSSLDGSTIASGPNRSASLRRTGLGSEIITRAPRDRARARSICAEMHSGFQNLRSMMSFNVEARLPGLANLDPGLQASVARHDPGNEHGVIYMWGTTGIGLWRQDGPWFDTMCR